MIMKKDECCQKEDCSPSCGCCKTGKSDSEKVEKVVEDLKKDTEMKKVNEET